METETERNGKTKNEAVRPKKWILEALTSLALKKKLKRYRMCDLSLL